MARNKKPCCSQRRTITQQDLPLACPAKDHSVWGAHPRIYLDIKPGKEAICPYCGTIYHLRLIESS